MVSAAASNDAPPGRGNFMIKIGGRPAIPFRVTLTKAEQGLHDTNKLWHEQSRRGELWPRHTSRRRTPGGLSADGAQADQARDRPLDALAAADGHARARRAWPPWRGKPPRRRARRSTIGATARRSIRSPWCSSSPTAGPAGRRRARRS